MPSDPILPYKVEGSSDPAIIAMMSRLNKNGIQVVSMGQNYLIRLPTTSLFPDQSPQLMWGSYQLLDEIGCFLKKFRKIAITITAYSSGCFSSDREHALTLARARAVGNYLWSQGIDSRFIFTQGLGNDKPIVGTAPNSDASFNSRIEITFREAIE